MAEQIPNLGALSSVKCNSSGSQVSVLISQVNEQQCFSLLAVSYFQSFKVLCVSTFVNSLSQINGRPDHKVYFYDIEMDTLTHFDFFSGRPSSGISHSEESERYLTFRILSCVEMSLLAGLWCTMFLSGSSLTRQIIVVAAQYHSSGMRMNLDFLFVKRCQSALNPHQIASWKR